MSDDSEFLNILNTELNNKENFEQTIPSTSKISKPIPLTTTISQPIPLPIKPISNLEYDYILIGGGPTGLTLAWYLAQQKKKVLIIEKEKELGGCHRVQRIDGLFTEHGPRVYSDSYINFTNLIKEMDLDYNEIFTPYTFDLTNIGTKKKTDLSLYERFCLGLGILALTFNSEYGKQTSILEYMKWFSFKEETIDYIDRIVRLSDGATAERYTVFQFLQLANQQFLYSLHQPRLPTDQGLIKLWVEKLIKTGFVKIKVNHEVTVINKNKDNIIDNIVVLDRSNLNQSEIKGGKYIITVPPKPLVKLLRNSKVENAFGNINELQKWSDLNSYFDYLPITMHWNYVVDLPKIQGLPLSEWGIAFIILSKYMKFEGSLEEKENSKTVISTCITFPERKSTFTNKTAHESSLIDIKTEIIRQLRTVIPKLPIPTKMLLSPQVYRDEKNKRWVNIDTAYVLTNENAHISAESKIYKNLYNCGSHNGKSKYYYTSLESAVSNAISLANVLEPKINKPLQETAQISRYIQLLLMVTVILLIARYYYKIK
jgi:hypothetical protein